MAVIYIVRRITFVKIVRYLQYWCQATPHLFHIQMDK